MGGATSICPAISKPHDGTARKNLAPIQQLQDRVRILFGSQLKVRAAGRIHPSSPYATFATGLHMIGCAKLAIAPRISLHHAVNCKGHTDDAGSASGRMNSLRPRVKCLKEYQRATIQDFQNSLSFSFSSYRNSIWNGKYPSIRTARHIRS